MNEAAAGAPGIAPSLFRIAQLLFPALDFAWAPKCSALGLSPFSIQIRDRLVLMNRSSGRRAWARSAAGRAVEAPQPEIHLRDCVPGLE